MQKIIEILKGIEHEQANSSVIQHAIDNLCASLDLSSKGLWLSECRQKLNADLADSGICWHILSFFLSSATA